MQQLLFKVSVHDSNHGINLQNISSKRWTSLYKIPIHISKTPFIQMSFASVDMGC